MKVREEVDRLESYEQEPTSFRKGKTNYLKDI